MSDLTEGVRSAHANPNYINNRADYAEYYKERYGAKGNRMAAESVYGQVKNSKGENVSVKNIMRQFQSRGGGVPKESAKSAAVYQQAGKQLPPTGYTPKQDTIHVTVHTTQADGQYRRGADGHTHWVAEGTRNRQFSATFSGPDAYAFVNNPDLATVLRGHGFTNEQDIENLTSEEGDSNSAMLTVTSVS